MAYDRYKCICLPMQSYMWTFQRSSISILIAWLLAGFISSPQLALFAYQNVPMFDRKFCWVHWYSKSWELAYNTFHLFTQFLIPLGLLAFFYIRIFMEVSKNVNYKSASLKMDRLEDEVLESRACCACFLCGSGSSDQCTGVKSREPMLENSKRKRSNIMPMRQNWSVEALSKSKLKTLKLTLTVICAYFLCVAPFYIGLFVHIVQSSQNYTQDYGKLHRK
jgi:hypothetical protein